MLLSAGGSEVLNTCVFAGVSDSEVLRLKREHRVRLCRQSTTCISDAGGSEVLNPLFFAGVSGSEVLHNMHLVPPVFQSKQVIRTRNIIFNVSAGCF